MTQYLDIFLPEKNLSLNGLKELSLIWLPHNFSTEFCEQLWPKDFKHFNYFSCIFSIFYSRNVHCTLTSHNKISCLQMAEIFICNFGLKNLNYKVICVC